MDFDTKWTKLLEQVNEWKASFNNSSFAKNLSEAELNNSGIIIEKYAYFMLKDYDRTAKRWTQKETVEILTNLFPTVLGADASIYQAVKPVLTQFLSFLEDSTTIKNSSSLIKGIEKAEKNMLKNSENATDTSTTTSSDETPEVKTTSASNEVEKAQTTPKYTYRTRARQAPVKKVPVRHTKIGRNQPCPCGSGLKYKKCCGK